MGKQRKLRSSMKVLQEAITSFRPAVGTPLCIQPAKTHSFRELLTSFNSVYYTPPCSSSSASSTAAVSTTSSYDLFYHQPPARNCPIPVREGKGEDESISSSTAASSSTCSSCLSSSSLVTAAADDDCKEPEALPRGKISSKRFFFSPCTSKSIMREAELEDTKTLYHPCPEAGETGEEGEEEDEVIDMAVETEEEDDAKGLCIMREGVPMSMASEDPYGDFRRSMEEMVEAHGLRGDWPALQELLHRYLRLNERKTHKYIVLAFVDLLMHLSSSDDEDNKHNLAFCPSPPHLFPSD